MAGTFKEFLQFLSSQPQVVARTTGDLGYPERFIFNGRRYRWSSKPGQPAKVWSARGPDVHLMAEPGKFYFPGSWQFATGELTKTKLTKFFKALYEFHCRSQQVLDANGVLLKAGDLVQLEGTSSFLVIKRFVSGVILTDDPTHSMLYPLNVRLMKESVLPSDFPFLAPADILQSSPVNSTFHLDHPAGRVDIEVFSRSGGGLNFVFSGPPLEPATYPNGRITAYLHPWELEDLDEFPQTEDRIRSYALFAGKDYVRRFLIALDKVSRSLKLGRNKEILAKIASYGFGVPEAQVFEGSLLNRQCSQDFLELAVRKAALDKLSESGNSLDVNLWVKPAY